MASRSPRGASLTSSSSRRRRRSRAGSGWARAAHGMRLCTRGFPFSRAPPLRGALGPIWEESRGATRSLSSTGATNGA
eukprot:6507308-Pyramimonas_sp.AAC.1